MPLHKTLVLSNLHLEANPADYNRLGRFLHQHAAERIIFCGNFLSFNGLENNKSAIVKVMEFFSTLSSISNSNNTEIIIVQDKTNELSNQLISLFGRSIKKFKQYTLESSGDTRFLVVEGDIAVLLETKIGKWLSKSSQGRNLLKKWMGVLTKLRSAVFSSNHRLDLLELIQEEEDGTSLEDLMEEFASKQGYAGVITAFSHKPVLHKKEHFTFINCGSWHKHQCALIEDYDQDWSLMYYNETDNKNKSILKAN